MINPQGELVNLPIDQARIAIDAGYKMETPQQAKARVLEEKYGDPVSQIKAGALGAARGLTMGLSDVVATQSGLIESEEARALREANPATSMVSEIGGALAPALASRGSSIGQAARIAGTPVRGVMAAGRRAEQWALKKLGSEAAEQAALRMIGTKAGSGLLGEIVKRGAAKGLGSAVEGAFFSSGQIVSEHALGNPNLTADKMIAHFGIGTLLGAGIGGVLGGTGAIGSAAFKRISAETAKRGGLSQIVDDFASHKAVKQMSGNQKHLEAMERRGAVTEIGRMVRQGHEALEGKAIMPGSGNLKKYLDNIKTVKEHHGALKGQIIKDLDSMLMATQRGLGGTAIGRAGKVQGVIDPKVVANRIRKELLPEASGIGLEAERKALEKLAKAWDNEPGMLSFAKADAYKKQIQKKLSPKFAKGNPSYKDQLLMRAEGIQNNEIYKAAQSVDEGLYNQLGEHNKWYGYMQMAEEKAAKGLIMQQKNRSIGLTDNIQGAVLGAGGLAMWGPAGLVAGPGAAIVNKIARERGNAWIASAAGKMARLSEMERAANSATRKIDTSINSMLAGKSAPVVPVASNALKQLQLGSDAKTPAQKIVKLKAIAANPEEMHRLTERAIRHISDIAPETARAIATKLNTAVQFLASKAPQQPESRTNATLTPHLVKPVVSEHDLAKFNRYLAAVESPQDVVKALGAGRLTPEAVEAMKVVYPDLYERISVEIARRAGELSKELPYDRRIQLSIWFGVPLDQTMTPQFIQQSQQWLAQMAAKEAQGQRPKKGGRGNQTRKLTKQPKSIDTERTSSERVSI
ncbi:MAG: hypothetical protein GY923_15255 [Aestuariibacter sp.]|nr:hypothetical protein [Aestuariibacter sp.]